MTAPFRGWEKRAQETFRALLMALAYPGRVFPLRGPSPEEALLRVAEALVDGSVGVHGPGFLLEALRAQGVRSALPQEADFLFAEGPGGLEDLARRARVGHPLSPEEGATLVAAVPLGRGPLLRVTGPGVEGEAFLRAPLPRGFLEVREARLAYPLGFEVFLVDGRGVVGLPRTAEVQVWDT
ncbi:hypothetical protein TthSNM11_23840 (plasmid) [Thermus thermophilus]|uniref:phosphonate C-P lyase system protein PhnH n=1 Tax=Thermus thermophilus TaxID=274 RepID=UPI001FCA61D3|nr:phosphonate C-P lyase system protein PhnH [Thermus thermophilus]BDG20181.1 hypothetical protein TthSNM11_23840 [Thermus thermophilus]BDG22733.1 hypothetical protein TthSNM17_23950 [Thermus thermophilus]BDG29803.1 hypothetical protein TthSNM76_20130 [Thermus thermophilus]